uniref:Uncharacterized protein n=1 Tax=Globodera rostochiensis TaxID=31243 RepID=A0A914HMP4_GLORO
MTPLRFLAVLLLVCAMFGMNQVALAQDESGDTSPDEAAVIRVRRGYNAGGGNQGGGWGNQGGGWGNQGGGWGNQGGGGWGKK